jgi:predicted ATPase/class 3 adenylate cyclase
MAELPSGTVTFLFTDLEGSTRLWEEHPAAMQAALARHDEILRGVIESHGGHVVKTTGDGFHAAFATADDGVRAAIAAQRVLAAHEWGETGELRVRMGLHTGAAEVRDGDYYGSSLNRAARLMGVAHGGQIVCSQATADLARDALPAETSLLDLGEHRLRDLSRAEHVFQVCVADLPADFPPLASLDAFPGNLPLQVTSFIGRQHELGRVADALRDARIVTLTGVGGVGKTRLAYQAAAEVLPRFHDGAWLVELAAVRDPDGVAGAVAAVFTVTARVGKTLTEALAEFFGSKELLLVLDNCEHLLDAVAELVDEVVRACPRLVVLATSREGFALDGERLLAVPSLGAPESGASIEATIGSDAVQLFAERARAVDDTFVLDDINADAVARVCRRLDGVPLAVELAAARVSVMSPAELVTALDRRFDVLAGGRRGAVKRQQTLRATIDWSYELLSDEGRRLLARLAVFAGGWTRDAAEAVCGVEPLSPRQVFPPLAELVAKSLVAAQRHGTETRYRMLETIREYGEERLAEHNDIARVRTAHAEYFCAWAELLTEQMAGPGQIEAARRLEAEHENLLAAMQHAVDIEDADLALRLLRNVPPPPIQIGYPLFLPVEPVVAMPGARAHPLYAFAWGVAGVQRASHGDLEAAEAACREAELAKVGTSPDGDHLADYMIGQARSQVVWSRGTGSDQAWMKQTVTACRALGRPQLLEQSLVACALFQATLGDVREAARLASEGLGIARSIGAPLDIVRNLGVLAAALADSEPARSRALLDEAVTLREDLGVEGYADSAQLTFNAAQLHDWGLVRRIAPGAIRGLHWAGQPVFLAGILNVAARAIADADPAAACVIQGTARRLATSAQPAPDAAASTSAAPPTAPTSASLVTRVRRETTALLAQGLGEERLHELRARGEALDNDHAVAFALDAIRTT